MVFLQNAIAFPCHLLHFCKERLAPQVGEVSREIFAVADDIRIRRVRANEVYRGIGKKIQIPRIAFPDDDFSCIFEGEIAFLMAPGKRRGIHIEADAVPMKELRLDKRRPAAGKLVEYPVAFFGVAKEKISGNVGGPVATIFGVMRRSAAAFGEIPDGIHLEFKVFGFPSHWFSSLCVSPCIQRSQEATVEARRRATLSLHTEERIISSTILLFSGTFPPTTICPKRS